MIIGVNTRMLLPGVKEGISRYIHETVSRMVLAHPEDTFHFYFDRPYHKQYLYADNVIPHIVSPPARHPILWWIWFDYMLPRRMKKDGVEVLYTGDGYASLRTDIPQVLVSHDLAFEHFDDMIKSNHLTYLRKYASRFHEKADAILAVSETTKQDIIKTYGIKTSKISVAGNSTTMQPAAAMDRSITNESDYFMYVGSLNPRKNIVKLVAAFDQFKEQYRSDHKLVLLGRLAWKSDKIKAAISDAKYAKDIVHIQDKVADVSRLISNATALIYPSVFEGFGIPILEGFACHTPVITSDIGSMAEVAGDAALLVDPYSIDEISAAMRQIQTDKNLKNDCINKGLERLKRYSWDQTAKTTYDVISNMNAHG